MFALAVVGCSGHRGPPAPVNDGGFINYHVKEAHPGNPVEYDVRFTFKKAGEGFVLNFDVNGPGPTAAAPVRVDPQLVPEDNIIKMLEVGRIWLPPDGRAQGKHTPCGAVTERRKY